MTHRSFRKHHGITPSQTRKGIGKQLQSYNRLTIQVNLKGVEPMKYKVVERDAFKVVGISKEFSCESMDTGIPGVPEFWGEVNGNGTAQQLIPLSNGKIKGLLGITTNYNSEENTVDYWIAAEHSGDFPEGLRSFEFPAAKWVVFEVRGAIPMAIINTWKQIYSEWFPSNSYEQANLAPIEAYIDSNLDNPNSVNEIWVAIK